MPYCTSAETDGYYFLLPMGARFPINEIKSARDTHWQVHSKRYIMLQAGEYIPVQAALQSIHSLGITAAPKFEGTKYLEVVKHMMCTPSMDTRQNIRDCPRDTTSKHFG